MILASASRTRSDMLRRAGVTFICHPADLDETAIAAGLSSDQAAAELARQKALAVSRHYPGQMVLGADSVLDLDGRTISKSPDLAAARALLEELSGREHRLISAAALARDGEIVWQHAAMVRLRMRTLSAGFLDAYLAAEGEALLSSVGCYRFEGLGAQLFEAVDGDFFAVLGLPLLPVLTALRGQGILAS